MAANAFTPFELQALNKGKLLVEINEDLKKLQADMIAFARRFGAEAEKAKGVLTLKLAVICVDPDSQQFALKVESSTTSPKRPADVAVAFTEEDERGTESLIVRTFGVRKEPGPKLPFTPQERIDPETGEVLEEDPVHSST